MYYTIEAFRMATCLLGNGLLDCGMRITRLQIADRELRIEKAGIRRSAKKGATYRV